MHPMKKHQKSAPKKCTRNKCTQQKTQPEKNHPKNFFFANFSVNNYRRDEGCYGDASFANLSLPVAQESTRPLFEVLLKTQQNEVLQKQCIMLCDTLGRIKYQLPETAYHGYFC